MELPRLIPIFPLPNVVLFPRTFLPLHIFEPRYRQMVLDASQGDKIIGMVLLKEGWEEDYDGTPLIYPLGCTGRMVRVDPLEDGRFNILLYGLSKFVINEEIVERRYRQAHISPSPDPPESLPQVLRATTQDLLLTYSRIVGIDHRVSSFLDTMPDDATLIHTFSFHLDCTPLEKQFLLEAETLVQQCRRLHDLLQFKILEVRPGRGVPGQDQ